MADVTVIGTGYVGLIQGVCLADVGHRVTCVDIDQAKIDMLRAGKSPIFEPGLEELLAKTIASGRITFATPDDGWADLLGDIVFVAVGTPQADNGAADLRFVRSVTSAIAAEATHPLTLVMKSTVPPGTGHALIRRTLAEAPVDIAYVSNPEFLREGKALEDWYRTDRIVIGSDTPDAAEAVSALYEAVDAPRVITDIASAETIKYASNAFLSTKISFINEIANLCDVIGADIDAVSHGIGMDTRIGPDFLRAGIGYGGSCFPKDTRALDFIATINGYEFSLLKSVIEVNNRQRLLPVIALVRALPHLHERTIAVLGLAFKPDTDDVRESPAVDIVPLLVEEGCSVKVYDPIAAEVEIPGATRCATVWEALDGVSAAVVITEWGEFATLDWERAAGMMTSPAVVFDGRNCLDPSKVEAAGLSYMAVGRPGAHRTGRSG
jgi:UDPglucose 6-dehydrogenase